SLGHRPGFRLILRHGPLLDPEALLTTLESLRTQVYRDWRLEILTRNSDTGLAIHTLISQAAQDLFERIDVVDALDEAAIDQPIGSAGQSTTLRLVGLLCAGDRLSCDALLQFALASGLHRT